MIFSAVVVASVLQEWHRHKLYSLLVSDLRHPGVLPHVNFKGAFLIEAFGICSGVPISLHLTPSKMTQHWVHAPKISGWKINCPLPPMVPFSPLVKFSPSASHLFLSLIPLLLSPPVPFPPYFSPRCLLLSSNLTRLHFSSSFVFSSLLPQVISLLFLLPLFTQPNLPTFILLPPTSSPLLHLSPPLCH